MDEVSQGSEIRYPFEQISEILYKQAHKVKQFFPNKYEVDELVNEVWLNGGIQRVKNPKFIAGRAYWDMIDYMKTIEGRQFLRKGVKHPRPKHYTNLHNLKTGIDPDGLHDHFQSIASRHREEINRVIDREEIEELLKVLSPKRRLIIEQYFFKEMTLVDIGKLTGTSESSACTKKAEAIKFIRGGNAIKVEKKKTNKEVAKKPLEQILPEYVADYEIGSGYVFEEVSEVFVDNKCEVEPENAYRE